MPSRIEELIKAWRSSAHPLIGRECFCHEQCAGELERAYREEVVPLTALATEILRVEKYRSNYASLTGSLYWAALVDMASKALRRFDAPAGTDPKQ